jgi:MFS family permease
MAVEVPSNLALKRFGSVWMAGLITSFGAVSIATAFITSYSGLIVTRVFLGLAEGGTLVCTSKVSIQIQVINRVLQSGLAYILSRVRDFTSLHKSS